MARKTSARRSTKSARKSSASTIRKSLDDAQAVFARYFESGGKRVKETFDALADIFESKHFASALRGAPARSRSSSRPRRGAATRAKPAKRAAAAARGARRTRRTRRKSS